MAERGFGEDREDRSVSERNEAVRERTEPKEIDQLIYNATIRQIHDRLLKTVEPGKTRTVEIGKDTIEVQRSEEGRAVISINDTPVIESQNGIVEIPEREISMADMGLLNMGAVAMRDAYEYERKRIKRETDDRTDNRERRDEADSRARNKDGDESESYDIEDEDRYADSR